MAPYPLLQQLPEELLQDVLSRIDRVSLSQLSLASKTCRHAAVPLLWKEVELVDCRSSEDEHDDTPLIKKLWVLATNPSLASCVQTVNHRCHLPPPTLKDLPYAGFDSRTLSCDVRTIRLLKLAVKHMEKVHTLRIIHGHPRLTEALIRCFFDRDRRCELPVRRFWLENCRIQDALEPEPNWPLYQLPGDLKFGGLERIRLRRMPLRAIHSPTPLYGFVKHNESGYARKVSGMTSQRVRNGTGGYEQTATYSSSEGKVEHDHQREMLSTAVVFDNNIFARLNGQNAFPPEVQADYNPYTRPSNNHTEPWKSMLGKGTQVALPLATDMLRSAWLTLTSLTLDSVIARPFLHRYMTARQHGDLVICYENLFNLRFPALKVFQYRSAVSEATAIPEGLYLFDAADEILHFKSEEHNQRPKTDVKDDCEPPHLGWAVFDFIEAHPKLECLAWPMGSFFAAKPSSDRHDRVNAVIDRLGLNLVDLRVDTATNEHFDTQSEEIRCIDIYVRNCRRRFISEFAARMHKLESIKIEGKVPRDERRETIRALRHCPLTKIVSIGFSCPLGNSWGFRGQYGPEILREIARDLEAEDKDAIYLLGPKSLEPPSLDTVFEPSYGWDGSPPLINTLASYHADTIKELKFCGFIGSPIVYTPTAITTPLLAALEYFHHLESLIMSMSLDTEFEGRSCDEQVISYWLDTRSPSSTALAVIVDDEEISEGSWQHQLRTKYAPDALAWGVANLIGPLLSETAKSRKGGVNVRGSFCLGQGAIFDLDIWIGKGSMNSDVCLRYEGPREELEPTRRRGKLENRRWF